MNLKSLNPLQKLGGMAVLCMFFGITACRNEQDLPPNILYILADDMGYGDLSVYNPEGKIATPYLDALAKQGMRFTDAHSPSSVCTPTRYSILTGRYPWRSRKPVGVLRGYSRTLIEPDQLTVAKLLRQHGYRTAVIGKWHLGVDWAVKEGREHLLESDDYGIATDMDPNDIDFEGPINGGPRAAGFEYSYILPASLDMPPYCYIENQKLVETPTDSTEGNSLDSGYTGPFWRGGLKSPSFVFEDVLPHFISKAIEFIDKQEAQRPFFLYLPLTGPHTPWLPDSNHSGHSGAGEYGDFVQQIDAAIGSILDKLDKRGLADQTLVIFASDNGPYWRQQEIEKYGHRSAGELRGMKADAYEGGHRIPFIVRWPGKVKDGTVSDATFSLTSLMATCMDILGETNSGYMPEDSYSLLPVLLGRSTLIEEQPAVVHSASNGYFAIRKGDWKLIEGLGSGGFTPPKEIVAAPGQAHGQLYNLAKDIQETQNLYDDHPDVVEELSRELMNIRETKSRILRNR